MEQSLLYSLGIDPIIIFLILLLVVVLLFVIVLGMKKRIVHLEAKYNSFLRGKNGMSLEGILEKRFDEIDKLKRADVKKSKIINEIIDCLNVSYQKTGLVKYDAFNDTGGKISFALALLTKDDDGFILNTMHGREGCYMYVKEIVRGESYIPLTEEEEQALAEAVKSDKYMLD